MGGRCDSPNLVEVITTTDCPWVMQANSQSSCAGSAPHTDQTVSSSSADARVDTVQGVSGTSTFRLSSG